MTKIKLKVGDSVRINKDKWDSTMHISKHFVGRIDHISNGFATVSNGEFYGDRAMVIRCDLLEIQS